jgi:hypothetical protein
MKRRNGEEISLLKEISKRNGGLAAVWPSAGENGVSVMKICSRRPSIESVINEKMAAREESVNISSNSVASISQEGKRKYLS